MQFRRGGFLSYAHDGLIERAGFRIGSEGPLGRDLRRLHLYEDRQLLGDVREPVVGGRRARAVHSPAPYLEIGLGQGLLLEQLLRGPLEIARCAAQDAHRLVEGLPDDVAHSRIDLLAVSSLYLRTWP